MKKRRERRRRETAVRTGKASGNRRKAERTISDPPATKRYDIDGRSIQRFIVYAETP